MPGMDVELNTFKRFRVSSVAEPVFYTEDKKRFVLVLFLPNFWVRTTRKKTNEIEDEKFRKRELHSDTTHRIFRFNGLD